MRSPIFQVAFAMATLTGSSFSTEVVTPVKEDVKEVILQKLVQMAKEQQEREEKIIDLVQSLQRDKLMTRVDSLEGGINSNRYLLEKHVSAVEDMVESLKGKVEELSDTQKRVQVSVVQNAESLQTQVEQLKGKVEELSDTQKRVQVSVVQNAESLQTQVEQLKGKVEELSDTQKKSQASVVQHAESLQTQVRQLKGKVEELSDTQKKGQASVVQGTELLQTQSDNITSKVDSLDGGVKANKDILQGIEHKVGDVERKVEVFSDTQKKCHASFVQHVESLQTQVGNLENRFEGLSDSQNETHFFIVKLAESLQTQKDMGDEESPVEEVSFKGWCPDPRGTDGGDCLYSMSHPRSWMSSREYCKSIGADLFVPLVRETIYFFGIYNLLDPEYRGKRYWVGAFGSSQKTSHWISGEKIWKLHIAQTDLEGKCFYLSRYDFLFQVTSCTEELYMICQKPTS
ncbi:uncharacterized protein LOC143037584 isoform X2 [Oratosquilla oratoria]|uniref:uncharacterized protein LOC143037584 isoform X2 n=1 Tax=Oratosquilla oratoria TaxID=337810 RepID=UPI003F77046C